MAPRIGIAMAVYNDEQYLPHALEALCAQSLRDFSLTVIDDGSTDGSTAVVERFSSRLPIRLLRAPHRGLRPAKRAAIESTEPTATYLLVLDSDIALPPHALQSMTELLDQDEGTAVVSAHARSDTSRPWGRGQAFLDDLFRHANADPAGQGRWIVGGCAMFRRSALDAFQVRIDVVEDSDLAERLRPSWRLLTPPGLVATHFGVPSTLHGVLHRGLREGVRVRSLLRVHPRARQITNLVRLLPLPLTLLGVLGAACLQPWTVALVSVTLTAYAGAFLVASRQVPGTVADRLLGAGAFVVTNLGFAVGYVLEAKLRGSVASQLDEPARLPRP